MKANKLTLDNLKIQSFVTSLEGEGDATINGGFILKSHIDGCRSALIECLPIVSNALCTIRTFNNCGSLVDACPSALSCPFDGTVLEGPLPYPKSF